VNGNVRVAWAAERASREWQRARRVEGHCGRRRAPALFEFQEGFVLEDVIDAGNDGQHDCRGHEDVVDMDGGE
jgi:hypothetical protein